jgi:uncharacterized sulfatase
LENDPYEKNNLANLSQYSETKKALKAKLKSWMKQQGDHGIQTEMKALTRQNRKGKWQSYEQKIKSKS